MKLTKNQANKLLEICQRMLALQKTAQWTVQPTGHHVMLHNGHKFEVMPDNSAGGWNLQHTDPRGQVNTLSPFSSPEKAKAHAHDLAGFNLGK